MKVMLLMAASIVGVSLAATARKSPAAPPAPVNPDHILGKVSIAPNQELGVRFKADGDRWLRPETEKQPGGAGALVRISLPVTDATPFPVKGVATRPYLVVSNGLERALQFRALARLKGSREFFEVSSAVESIPAGEESVVRCWESGSLVEEVVLYQFALAPKARK